MSRNPVQKDMSLQVVLVVSGSFSLIISSVGADAWWKTLFLPPFLSSWREREGNGGRGPRFVPVINVQRVINLSLTQFRCWLFYLKHKTMVYSLCSWVCHMCGGRFQTANPKKALLIRWWKVINQRKLENLVFPFFFLLLFICPHLKGPFIHFWFSNVLIWCPLWAYYQ